MRILWLSTIFLHPLNRGGRIRTWNILRHLHDRHEVHYLALQNQYEPEGFARSGEYSSSAYAVPHVAPPRQSVAAVLQAAAGMFSPLPLAVSRYRVPAMRKKAEELMRSIPFDRVVCDFLAAAPNVPDLGSAVLFQHNVETMIWRRQSAQASDPLRKLFLKLQSRKMFAYERQACRRAAHIIAVSQADADWMEQMFGVGKVSTIDTAVDIESFRRGGEGAPVADLCFVGSMDWMPNIDAVLHFVQNILPLIRVHLHACTFAVVGRKPPPAIADLAKSDPKIIVTGTVEDVRPYLFGSLISVVPLRSGGGTRLKIYESMAAAVPVVSTSIGAEGLQVVSGENIEIADDPAEFAARCVALLQNPAHRARIAEAGRHLVASRFSSAAVARQFEQVLENAALPINGNRIAPV